LKKLDHPNIVKLKDVEIKKEESLNTNKKDEASVTIYTKSGVSNKVLS